MRTSYTQTPSGHIQFFGPAAPVHKIGSLLAAPAGSVPEVQTQSQSKRTRRRNYCIDRSGWLDDAVSVVIGSEAASMIEAGVFFLALLLFQSGRGRILWTSERVCNFFANFLNHSPNKKPFFVRSKRADWRQSITQAPPGVAP